MKKYTLCLANPNEITHRGNCIIREGSDLTQGELVICENALNANNWIKVSERLPSIEQAKNAEEFLVYGYYLLHGCSGRPMRQVAYASHLDGKVFFQVPYRFVVTYWQPLPNTPKD